MDFQACIKQAFTIDAGKELVTKLDTTPYVATLQLTTNGVKLYQHATVVEEYQNLVDTIKTKLPHSKVITSHAPHNTSRGSVCTALVNASLSDAYHDKNLVCINNKNVTPFAIDGIHFIWSGTSALPHNIKAAVNESPGITSPPHRHPNSNCHHPNSNCHYSNFNPHHSMLNYQSPNHHQSQCWDQPCGDCIKTVNAM